MCNHKNCIFMNRKNINMSHEYLFVDWIILKFAREKVYSLNSPCPQASFILPRDRGIFIVF